MIFQPAKVGTVQIRGTDCDVFLTKAGRFRICRATGSDDSAGPQLGMDGDSFEIAQRSAAQELAKSKVKVAVKFRTYGGGHFTAMGIHSGMHKVTVRNSRHGNSTEYLDLGTMAYQPETPDEVFTRMREIQKEIHRLQEERRRLDNQHGFRLGSTVQAAVNQAAQDQVDKGGL